MNRPDSSGSSTARREQNRRRWRRRRLEDGGEIHRSCPRLPPNRASFGGGER
uniref:Uncharacterized protein n=1 Tax=Oryza punctata TaxID=4537 RepID=A0A0E0M955_ORYPU